MHRVVWSSGVAGQGSWPSPPRGRAARGRGGLSRLPASASAAGFSDVPASNPYYAAITALSSRGIISGFSDGTFGPDKPVLRKQFAKMIVGAMGLTVTEHDWQDASRPFADLGPRRPEQSLSPRLHRCGQGARPDRRQDAHHVRAQRQHHPGADGDHGGAGGSELWASTWLPWAPTTSVPFSGYANATHGENVHVADYNGLLRGLLVAGDPSAWMAANATRGEVAQVLWNLMQLRTTGPADDITRYGVDYSMTNVDWPAYFSALKASGRDFIGRYLPWKGSTWRQVTAAELKAAADAGVDYFFWFEDSDNHFRARDGGFATGVADAQQALRSLASLDLPATTPVYFTVDFPCPDGNQIDAYFRGVNSVLPVSQIGAYGNYTTIDWLYQHGLATYFCESDAWPEPEGWHPQAQMHQYTGTYRIGGVSVDRLTVTAADFGQCRRHEESDPRLSYSGAWTPSGDPAGAYSGGKYAYFGRFGGVGDRRLLRHEPRLGGDAELRRRFGPHHARWSRCRHGESLLRHSAVPAGGVEQRRPFQGLPRADDHAERGTAERRRLRHSGKRHSVQLTRSGPCTWTQPRC